MGKSGFKIDSEINTRNSVRRSAVSSIDIAKGSMLTEDMIVFKRPGDGIPSTQISDILGKKAVLDIPKDEKLVKEWFE